MNHSFSKIWIPIILIIVFAGGFFAWQYFGASKEEIKAPVVEVVEDETANWQIYTDKEHGFEVQYPEDSTVVKSQFAETTRINLPFVSGTTLHEKYLLIKVEKSTSEECSNPMSTMIKEVKTVYFNDIKFKKEIGGEAGAGSLWDSVSYSTMKGNQCFSLSFILRSVNPGMFDVPPPNFDREKESEILDQILSTFRFLE